jgi:2-oxoglutarate dehydrogenase E2 component (dihydrolipoamide succinyltransferase)
MAVELKVPEVGESVTEVEIGEWLKAPGDAVRQDEPVVSLETDKATVELPAPASGVMGKILKQRGDRARVGEVIGYLEETAVGAAPAPSSAPPARAGREAAAARPAAAPGQAAATRPAAPRPGAAARTRPEAAPEEDAAATQPAAAAGEAALTRPAAAPGAAAAALGEEAAAVTPSRPQPDTIRVTPAARRLLTEHGLSPEEVTATGPGGRLTKEDVLRHVAGDGGGEEPAAPPGAAPPAPAAREAEAGAPAASPPRAAAAPRAAARPAAGREEEVVPMTPLRRRVAERLVEAQKTAALLTTFNEIDMSAVVALRRAHQEAFQRRHQVKLGFMSFFAKATIEALKRVPGLNAEIRGPSIVYRSYHDIGIAIGGGRGLVVPVLRSAERMSFAEIETAIADFARRAEANKLLPDELAGGTFTISNGGVYGSLLSTPIVNPPQSGILGLHVIQDRPVAREGQVVIRPMMNVALTYDHRIVDGREAVTFLRHVKECVEEPARILLEL